MNPILTEALKLHSAGYCVIPIKLDGTKAPDLKTWKHFKEVRPDEAEVKAWFEKSAPGLGIIGGCSSSGVECLDFDNHKDGGGVFRQWCETVPVEVLSKLVIYRTPRDGWRAVYRCDTYLDGAKDILAKRSKDDPLIELLAAHVVVVPGGNVAAHETKRPYTYKWRHLAEVRTVTADDRQVLLDVARRFNTYQEPSRRDRKSYLNRDTDHLSEVKPDWFASDDFNLRANWTDILEPHGWSHAGCSGDVEFWSRPGKYQGVSATTNHLGLDLLHVFTSSTEFEADRSYSKYAAYALLNHGGDYSQASKELARLGYGRANDKTNTLYEKIERLSLYGHKLYSKD